MEVINGVINKVVYNALEGIFVIKQKREKTGEVLSRSCGNQTGNYSPMILTSRTR